VLGGESLAKAGRLQEAWAVLGEAVRRAPKDGEAGLLLGEVARRTGDGGLALDALRRAGALMPGDERVIRAMKRLGVGS